MYLSFDYSRHLGRCPVLSQRLPLITWPCAPPAGRDYVPMSATRRIIHQSDKTEYLGLRWERELRDKALVREISTSWAPSRSQKGNSFIFLFTIEHLGALSNLTLSVRKSISYFDQNLILGTMYWPADIDVINIDRDGEYRRQFYFSLIQIFWEMYMFSHLLHCQWSNISLFHHWINIVG